MAETNRIEQEHAEQTEKASTHVKDKSEPTYLEMKQITKP